MLRIIAYKLHRFISFSVRSGFAGWDGEECGISKIFSHQKSARCADRELNKMAPVSQKTRVSGGGVLLYQIVSFEMS